MFHRFLLVAAFMSLVTPLCAQTYPSPRVGSVKFRGNTADPTNQTVLQAQPSASGTLGLPSATDILVGRNTTDTLTNKTLTSPSITNPSFTGTFTVGGVVEVFPPSGLLVGTTDTQTFTGKTFDTAGSGNVFKINGTQITSVTGSGAAVLAASPTLITPNIGAATGTSLNLTALTASSAIATDASKNLVSVTNTGTGNNVLANSPVLVSPNLGTPSAVTLTNATGLPLTTGVTGTLGIGNGGTGGTTQATAQAGLGLGTAATQNTGTSGHTVPFLDGSNTWSAAQTFSVNPVFPSQSANVVFAAPNGSSGAPSFRALVAQDSGAGVVQYDLSRNSTANNASIAFSFSGSSFSASGTAGTTCGGTGTFNFPCLQNYNITGDTVNSSTAGALDGWQFTHSFGGSNVQGARQSVDIISTFTAATSASNGNRNYVPLATYMQVNAGDGGTAGTPKGSWFGANHVVRGVATYASSVAGQENDVGIFGTTYWRLGYSAVSFPGTEGTNLDAAYELGAASGANATNWVNALFLSNAHGLPPLSTGGCVICTDGSANTIAQGIDLHTYTINGYFLRSANFSVDGSGNTTATSYRLSNMLSSTTVPVIASGFCTSPTITAANGTAAFKITVGSVCSAGNGTLTMPAAANDWSCTATDLTNPSSHVIVQAGHGPTLAGFSDFSRTTGAAQNMGSGDVILVQCSAL